MASLELNAGTNFILVILIIGGINWLVTMLRLGTTYGFSGSEQAWASHPRDALSWIGDYIKKSGGSALASLSPQLIIYLIVGICAIVLCFTIAHAHVNSSKNVENFGTNKTYDVLYHYGRDNFDWCKQVRDANLDLYNTRLAANLPGCQYDGSGCTIDGVEKWLQTNTNVSTNTNASTINDFNKLFVDCYNIDWGGLTGASPGKGSIATGFWPPVDDPPPGHN